MPSINRQWLLKRRPQGMLKESDFEYREAPMPAVDLAAGQVLIKNLYFSFEPAMRGWLDDVPSYMPPVAIGEVMRASTVGQVMRSSNPSLPEGALVQGMFGWQDYAVGDPASAFPPRPVPEGVPPATLMSVFGGTSYTAYFGLLDVGQPRPGETVLVSAAAGATGSVVAQIARIKGCRVIGIAGGQEKCDWLKTACRLDAVIDYKHENIEQRLAALCPRSIDLFFDNVGGTTLEAGLEQMADHGRIILCGQISAYNDATPQPGPRNLMLVVTRRLRMQGFIMMDYVARIPEAMNDLSTWVSQGEIAWREDVQEGFENIPKTLLRLFAGKNQGKQLLKVAEPQ
ncbi:MAG: NADP-dependent oxidoreductase [Spongiibacteraceae bacterium]|nr:NADP-dependent oxidoreductase [Spongiibacteraceae bacterium]